MQKGLPRSSHRLVGIYKIVIEPNLNLTRSDLKKATTRLKAKLSAFMFDAINMRVWHYYTNAITTVF